MKLYLLKWDDNRMIGGFRGDDLCQIFNTNKEMLLFSIENAMKLYSVKSFEIEILHSYEEINKMRKDRGLEIKIPV